MTDKLYANRDHRALGDHYINHVSAMTGEGLHRKSEIAAELAWRDSEIERLRAALTVSEGAQELIERGRAGAAQAGLTALERNAATKDSARLQFLEDQTMEGHAPNLVFDDDGNWSVSYTGMQPIPRGGGRGFDETVTIACIVEPGEWRPSIREAIDAAIAAAEAGNVGAV